MSQAPMDQPEAPREFVDVTPCKKPNLPLFSPAAAAPPPGKATTTTTTTTFPPLLVQPACYESSPASVIALAQSGAMVGKRGEALGFQAATASVVSLFEQRVAAATLQHTALLTRTLESEFGDTVHALQSHFEADLKAKQMDFSSALSDSRGQLEVCTDQLVAAQTALKATQRSLLSLRQRACAGMQTHREMLLNRRVFDALQNHARMQRGQRKFVLWISKLQRERALRRAFRRWSSAAAQARFSMLNSFWQRQMEDNAAKLITKYEAELIKLRKTVHEQELAQRASEQSRKELEKRLKQVFLKGVSAMNLEAVNIFSAEHAEQQQRR